jgi:hypothetical protein
MPRLLVDQIEQEPLAELRFRELNQSIAGERLLRRILRGNRCDNALADAIILEFDEACRIIKQSRALLLINSSLKPDFTCLGTSSFVNEACARRSDPVLPNKPNTRTRNSLT